MIFQSNFPQFTQWKFWQILKCQICFIRFPSFFTYPNINILLLFPLAMGLLQKLQILPWFKLYKKILIEGPYYSPHWMMVQVVCYSKKMLYWWHEYCLPHISYCVDIRKMFIQTLHAFVWFLIFETFLSLSSQKKLSWYQRQLDCSHLNMWLLGSLQIRW